ncbi:DUF6299 family protein [Embleya scabrispora]|uniref:DUF6299 family protein n=1 Tax=Embleya scabrispora TaxID=159449 RepID=UPI000363716F|nr:DUF6299 family protein [Embleya scabrispora]MYS83460.1 hypothetical protein [Streptomyces sp. SID5474]
MMITVGRTAMALSAGFAGLVLAFAPVAAQAHTPPRGDVRAGGDQVSLDWTVWVAADGAFTLSGTYRCSAVHAGAVLVGGSVSQAGHHAVIGGSVATCDGRTHTWRNTAPPHIGFVPGAASGDATLLELRHDDNLIPALPHLLAHDAHDVVIRRP